MRKLSILTALLLILIGCTERKNHKNVKCYKHYDNTTNSWIYYYVLFQDNGRNSYYQSSSQLNDYNTVNWSPISSSSDVPSFNSEQEVPISGDFVESAGFEGETGSTSAESSGESESSGFGGDSGSSDSGGGDSGGGDGGSGGE